MAPILQVFFRESEFIDSTAFDRDINESNPSFRRYVSIVNHAAGFCTQTN
jgi:hypothetical protein